MFSSDLLEWFLWPWSCFFSRPYWEVIFRIHLSGYLTIDQHRDTCLEIRGSSTLWSWTVNALKFDFRRQRDTFERHNNSNKYSLTGGARWAYYHVNAVCTTGVVQYGYPLAGFSWPARPGWVTGSETHSELQSMATEVQAEILQLPHCWKVQIWPLVVQGVLQGVNTL